MSCLSEKPGAVDGISVTSVSNRSSFMEEGFMLLHSLNLSWRENHGHINIWPGFLQSGQTSTKRVRPEAGWPVTLKIGLQWPRLHQRFHNIPRQHCQLGSKCSNTKACGGHFTLNCDTGGPD